jgi:hypothetical protein
VTFLFLFSGKIYGWTWNDSTLFTPQQLREDADFFFETLQQKHPDVYYYCGMEEFERKKHQVYEKLDVSMTGIRFLELMNTMNSCLDNHTRLLSIIAYYGDKFVEAIAGNNELVFVPEDIRDGKLYYTISGKKVSVVSINGINVQLILSVLNEWEWIQPLKRKSYNMWRYFTICLHSYFDVHSPFEIEYEENRQSFQVEIEGVSIMDEINRGKKSTEYYDQHSSVYYQVYPQSSMAILYLHSFLMEELNKSEFTRKMEELSNQLRQHRIQHLFVDVSKNSGGHFEEVCRFFDYLSHDTIYLNYSKIERESPSVTKYIPYSKTLVRLPEKNNLLFSGDLFVLQSMTTASAADDFCRIVAQNSLGVLIGQDTGTHTRGFSSIWSFELPHTKLPFQVASAFWDFSRDFNTETLTPDMYWDTNFREEFSEEELQSIVKQWEEQKKN